MSKASAPPAPDYTAAAQETAAGNMANLQYQTQANRPTTTTPWGTDTWSQDGNNNWTQTVSLTPDQQAALNSQQQVQQNQSQLAQTLQGQVANTMAGGFNAPQLGSYTNGVSSVNTGFGNFNPTGVSSVNQNYANGPSQSLNFSGSPSLNTNFSAGQSAYTDPNQFTSSAGSVNLNAPQFSSADAQQGAQSAYNASTGLLQDQWNQANTNLDSQLRLQGITPGSEAYNNAMQNQQRTQAQQQDQLANQAVQTGANIANQNYASALAGYGAQNTAQNQAYNQGLSSMSAANSGIGQNYSQGLGAFSANNAALGQNYANALGAYGAQNQAASTQANQNLSAYNAGNAAQNQAYSQALAGYGANQNALQNYNAAQSQQYGQALNSYQTAYQAALQNYLQPLNNMNAVLYGNQVQMPSFGSQPNSSAGYTGGTDYSSAANMLGQYNSGVAAQNGANSSSLMGTLGGLGSAAMMAFMMA